MPSFRISLSGRKDISLRLTRWGVTALLFFVALFSQAYMHDLNLAYLLLFFLFSLSIVAALAAFHTLRHFSLSRIDCGRLFADQEGLCSIDVTNGSGFALWSLSIECGPCHRPLPPLAPKERRRIPCPLTMAKRGRHTLPLVLMSRYPFALFTLKKKITNVEIIVFPAPQGRSLTDFNDARRAPFGHESDFDGLSEMQGMIGATRIHWPSVAKGTPMVKTFVKQIHDERLRFDYDRLQGSKERRLSQLTRWVLEAERRGRSFTLRLGDRCYRSDKEGVDGILRILAEY